ERTRQRSPRACCTPFLERDPASEACDSSRDDARCQSELWAGQAVDRRDAARVERVEDLEVQLEESALTEPESLRRLDRDYLHGRRRVFAVLAHPQRHRALPQHGRSRRELLRPLLPLARL